MLPKIILLLDPDPMTSNIAIIPVKHQSERVENKNFKPFSASGQSLFDLLVDNEIDPKFYCYADNVDKKNNLLSDQNLIFDCEEQEGKQENIYKIKVKKEDFKEPC